MVTEKALKEIMELSQDERHQLWMSSSPEEKRILMGKVMADHYSLKRRFRWWVRTHKPQIIAIVVGIIIFFLTTPYGGIFSELWDKYVLEKFKT
jgi:hypothetical protein